MKLTVAQLRRIIKEEVSRSLKSRRLNEAYSPESCKVVVGELIAAFAGVEPMNVRLHSHADQTESGQLTVDVEFQSEEDCNTLLRAMGEEPEDM